MKLSNLRSLFMQQNGLKSQVFLFNKSLTNFSGPVTIEMIKKLRDETGSPIGQCKASLEEANGDYQVAKQIIIKQGLAQAAQKLDKVTRAGVIGLQISENRQIGSIIELNCETDFVARTQLFLQFANGLLNSLNSYPQTENIDLSEESADLAQIEQFQQSHQLSEPLFDDFSQSIEKNRHFLISKLQENINIRRVKRIALQDEGIIGGYVHNKLAPNSGNSACLVQVNAKGIDSSPEFNEFADNMALQILGMKPLYQTQATIPADIMQAEREQAIADLGDQLKGKPAEMQEKIIQGKLKKFYEDTVLYEQPFILDSNEDSLNITQYIKQIEKQISASTVSIGQYSSWSCQ